jgi:hypothetical protein
MKLSRFGIPDHDKTSLLLDVGRRVEDSAFVSDYDERFYGGGVMKNQ